MRATGGDGVRLQDNILSMGFHKVLESCGKSGCESPLCARDVVMSGQLRTRHNDLRSTKVISIWYHGSEHATDNIPRTEC
jgi:hypothetical protein